MLELTVNDGEQDVVLQFEHSLLSLSKWESRTRKAFLTKTAKTSEELIEYFQDMLLSPGVDPSYVYLLNAPQLQELNDYINATLSASSVPADTGPKKFNPEVTTSELIYYWMVGLNIPFQPCESWHISRLLMLIQITSYKNQPQKKTKPDTNTLAEWKAINERQKQMLGTTG